MKHFIFFLYFITLLTQSVFSQTCPSLTYNGKTYKTVQIGTQCWMAENLNDAGHTFGNSSTYDANNSSLTLAEKQCISDKYGRLYDYYAAINIGSKIAGWHLPTDPEWTTLSTYLGGESVAGGKMKVGGVSGFDALLGGYQNGDGSYSSDIGYIAYFWSSSPHRSDYAWYRYIESNNSMLNRSPYYNSYRKNELFSVRLVKD